MLTRFIQVRAALQAAFHRISKEENVPKDLRLPSEEEWARLTALSAVLRLFLTATKVLEGDGLTIHLVPTTLHDLCTALAKIIDNGSKYERTLAQTFHQELQGRLARHEIFLKPNCALLAAALHPRYASLSMCSQSVQDEVWAELEQRADKICKKVIGEEAMWAELTRSPSEYVRRVRSYFHTMPDKGPQGAAGTDFALNFWRTQFQVDHTLRPLLCAMWCVPASSAGAERLFSSLGQLHTTNQEIDTLYNWAMLRDWARSPGYSLSALVDSIAGRTAKAPDVIELV
jgi:hypothetical protein